MPTVQESGGTAPRSAPPPDWHNYINGAPKPPKDRDAVLHGRLPSLRTWLVLRWALITGRARWVAYCFCGHSQDLRPDPDFNWCDRCLRKLVYRRIHVRVKAKSIHCFGNVVIAPAEVQRHWSSIDEARAERRRIRRLELGI